METTTSMSRLAQLQKDHMLIVSANQKSLEILNWVKAYIFSPRTRKVLFKLASLDVKKRTIVSILEKFNTARGNFEICRDKTVEFLEVMKNENIFSQKMHNKKAVAFLHNAVHNQKKQKEYFSKLKPLIVALESPESYSKIKKISREIKSYFELLLASLEDNKVYLKDFEGRLRIEAYLRQTYGQIIGRNLLSKKEGFRYLKSGDIFVSFKTSSFLEKEKSQSSFFSRISNRITFFTGSQVTHVALFAFYKERTEPMLIHSYGGVYKAEPAELSSGAVFFVLRPKMTPGQRAKLWRAVRERLKQKPKLTRKVLIAATPAILINKVVNLFSRRYINIGRTLEGTQAEMFCSQFLNQVFLDAGFMLTPKSKLSKSVYPADIVASPSVRFIGTLFKPDDFTKDKILEELVKGVKI